MNPLDTLEIIKDTMKIEPIYLPDTLNIKTFSQNASNNTYEILKEFITFIAGIAAVCLGYLLNILNDYLKENKSNRIEFEKQLLRFSKGDITYFELLLDHNKLTKKLKNKIKINDLEQTKDPSDRVAKCLEIMKKLNSK